MAATIANPNRLMPAVRLPRRGLMAGRSAKALRPREELSARYGQSEPLIPVLYHTRHTQFTAFSNALLAAVRLPLFLLPDIKRRVADAVLAGESRSPWCRSFARRCFLRRARAAPCRACGPSWLPRVSTVRAPRGKRTLERVRQPAQVPGFQIFAATRTELRCNAVGS